MERGVFAENVRRAAGAHLVSLDALASYVEMTRPGLMKLVAFDASARTNAKAETATRLAEAFGLDVRDLFSAPLMCLRAVIANFEQAPIRAVARIPDPWAKGEEPVAPPVSLRDARRQRGR